MWYNNKRLNKDMKGRLEMEPIVISNRIPKTELYKKLEKQVKDGVITEEEMLEKLSGRYRMVERNK